MSVRDPLTTAATFLLGDSGSPAPAAAHALVQSGDVGAYTLTGGRLWGTAVALLGLAGVVLGGMALARSRRHVGNGGRNWVVVTLGAGLIAVAGGALNLAVADGGPGTGNGVVAGALGLLLGLLAVAFAGLVAARSRHTG